MGRSVSYPSNAQVVCYSYELEGEPFFYEDIVEDIRETCKSEWKSLSDCEIWLDREDCAVLENELCYIGVSEYCSLVSIWIVPKEEYENIASNWIAQIERKFRRFFARLCKVGTFSNGEAVFEEIQHVVLA